MSKKMKRKQKNRMLNDDWQHRRITSIVKEEKNKKKRERAKKEKKKKKKKRININCHCHNRQRYGEKEKKKNNMSVSLLSPYQHHTVWNSFEQKRVSYKFTNIDRKRWSCVVRFRH